MGFFILMFFGVGTWFTYMMFRSFVGGDSGRSYERDYRGLDGFYDDEDDLDTFDKVQRAYDSGRIDTSDLQELYDSGVIDDIEAEAIDCDAIDFDDDDGF